jgi:hypothetical protein
VSEFDNDEQIESTDGHHLAELEEDVRSDLALLRELLALTQAVVDGVLNPRYRATPAARTMPVMLWVAARPAVVEVDGLATAPAMVLGFLWRRASPTLRLPSKDSPDNVQASDQSGWPDSNRRPPAPKAGALTKLRYIPQTDP